MDLRKRTYQFSLDWKLLEESGYVFVGSLHCLPKLKCPMNIITTARKKLVREDMMCLLTKLYKFFPTKQWHEITNYCYHFSDNGLLGDLSFKHFSIPTTWF